MLETVSDLVRNITMIVLLAIFIEMLLPGSDMTRYLQLIMGLFILITILTPVISILQVDGMLESAFFNFSEKEADTESILAKGERVRNIGRAYVSEEYRLHLQSQIETLARLVPGVKDVKATANFSEEGGSNLHKIDAIILNISLEEPAILIQSVEIGSSKEESEVVSEEKERIRNKLKKTLADFYGVREDKISVIFR